MIGGLNGLKGLNPRKAQGGIKPRVVYVAGGGQSGGTSFTVTIDNSQIKQGDLALAFYLEKENKSSLTLAGFALHENYNSPTAHQYRMYSRVLDGTETVATFANLSSGSRAAIIVVVRNWKGIEPGSIPLTILSMPNGSTHSRAGGTANNAGIYLFVIARLDAAAISTPPEGMEQLINYSAATLRLAAYVQKGVRKGDVIGTKTVTYATSEVAAKWSGLIV